MAPHIVIVDIGGMQKWAALSDRTCTIIHHVAYPALVQEAPGHVVEGTKKAICEAAGKCLGEIHAIGIASAGHMDSRGGVTTQPTNPTA